LRSAGRVRHRRCPPPPLRLLLLLLLLLLLPSIACVVCILIACWD